MIDPNPLPSRQLRMTASIARWALRFLLAFWLLLIGVGVVLHGFIVPRISTWGGQVERLASDALGIPIKIGEISARSEGLFPTIELSQLRLIGEQNETALLLPRVVVTISARSLLRLGVEQIYIESASLNIRRLASGEWQIAGIPPTPSDTADHSALEWLLTQPELALTHGNIDFVDEKNAGARTTLTKVKAVFRHQGWSHRIRIDATPTNAPDQSLQVLGDLHQPLLPSTRPVWKRWSGQWYANVFMHQVPALPFPDSWHIDNIHGAANARFWLDVSKGEAIGITTDVALSEASLSWIDEQLPPLDLGRLQGRLHIDAKPQGWRVSASNFGFTQQNGKQWPSSDWAFVTSNSHDTLQQLEGSLSYADLSMAASVLQALPLSSKLHQALGRWQPKGEVRSLKFSWNQENRYHASGEVHGLSLREQMAEHGVGTPGVQGLNGFFQMHEKGGHAQLSMQSGALILPGVFEEMNLPLNTFNAAVHWQRLGEQWRVTVPEASFSNADAAGQLQASWQTGQHGNAKFPGSLKLSGALERADGGRVFRYLPLAIPQSARYYVRDTVLQGQGKHVKFEVQGNLQDMPFTKPGSGRFYIEAPVQDVIFNFVPPHLRALPDTAWPALEKLSGRLIFEGNSMEVRQATTSFAGHSKLQIASVSASIPDLSHPHVTIKALGHSDLDSLLNFVTHSPLAEITSHALDHAQGNKEATISFDLSLPISDLRKSLVRGRLGFHGNDLQLDSYVPPLNKLQGEVHFHSQGFNLDHVTAQTLGGSVSISGGMESPETGLNIYANGTASASGLRTAVYLPAVSEIAQHALGETSYDVEIKAHQGDQFIRVQSDLKGLGIQLPPPFSKTVEQILPLSVTQSNFDQHFQEIKVEAETIGTLSYVRNTKNATQPLVSAALLIGPPVSQTERLEKFPASINLESLDADAWLDLLEQSEFNAPQKDIDYFLPTFFSIHIDSLQIRNQKFKKLSAFAQRNSNSWSIKAKSDRFNGVIEYHPKNDKNISGLVYARLTDLNIDENPNDKIEPVKFKKSSATILPELDISVDSIIFSGKNLGKLEFKANNHFLNFKRLWKIEKFEFKTSDTTWQADGVWQSAGDSKNSETKLRFLLDTKNAGQLLGRFGMADVIRDGQGQINGNISWQGSPLSPDVPTLTGSIHLEMGKGQFLKIEPGIGKLLSVLSLQSITRRINLDFRDVFSQGFSFDFIRGDLQVQQGIATTNNLQMKGLNAAVFMEGSANLKSEQQDLNVVVIPEINAMTASLAATAINPIIGLGSFLAQMLLRAPLMEAATRSFHIHGSWYEPSVDPIKNSSDIPERIPSLVKP